MLFVSQESLSESFIRNEFGLMGHPDELGMHMNLPAMFPDLVVPVEASRIVDAGMGEGAACLSLGIGVFQTQAVHLFSGFQHFLHQLMVVPVGQVVVYLKTHGLFGRGLLLDQPGITYLLLDYLQLCLFLELLLFQF